ncbi:MAG: DUF4912 domain-containing protein [Bradymonadaceae bacterium]
MSDARFSSPWGEVGQTAIDLLPSTAERGYVYWEFTAEAAADGRPEGNGTEFVGRVLRVDGRAGRVVETFPVDPGADGRFVDLDPWTARHVAVLGFSTADGSFEELARSEVVETSASAGDEPASVEFVRVDVTDRGLSVVSSDDSVSSGAVPSDEASTRPGTSSDSGGRR